MTEYDTRPENCRFRLQDEGKAYPRSSCKGCGKNITTGLGNRCAEPASRSPAMTAPDKAPENFQTGVEKWMDACFGPEISADKLERGDRLLEEVFELLQSGDYPRERVRALEGYVWGRDKGEPEQEVGGVMVTLAAYCSAHNISMQNAGDTELARVWTKVEKIRAKQAAKPTGSALPIATDEKPMVRADVADAMVAERELALVLAAYEAAADFVEGWLDGSLDPSNMRLLHGDICSIPSADARAALAEAERKAWNAALDATLKAYDAEWRENTATKRAAIAALKKETQG